MSINPSAFEGAPPVRTHNDGSQTYGPYVASPSPSSEKTFQNEAEAHRVRRQYINSGRMVSLIAYDPSRNVYVFDLYSR